MSDLKPTGEALVIDGVERHLLFTLNVDDDIQAHFDAPIEDVINMLTDKKTSSSALRYTLAALLNDEADRLDHAGVKHELKRYTEQEIGWVVTRDNLAEVLIAVLKAYGLSLPEPDEFESPNGESGQTS